VWGRRRFKSGWREGRKGEEQKNQRVVNTSQRRKNKILVGASMTLCLWLKKGKKGPDKKGKKGTRWEEESARGKGMEPTMTTCKKKLKRKTDRELA